MSDNQVSLRERTERLVRDPKFRGIFTRQLVLKAAETPSERKRVNLAFDQAIHNGRLGYEPLEVIASRREKCSVARLRPEGTGVGVILKVLTDPREYGLEVVENQVRGGLIGTYKDPSRRFCALLLKDYGSTHLEEEIKTLLAKRKNQLDDLEGVETQRRLEMVLDQAVKNNAIHSATTRTNKPSKPDFDNRRKRIENSWLDKQTKDVFLEAHPYLANTLEYYDRVVELVDIGAWGRNCMVRGDVLHPIDFGLSRRLPGHAVADCLGFYDLSEDEFDKYIKLWKETFNDHIRSEKRRLKTSGKNPVSHFILDLIEQMKHTGGLSSPREEEVIRGILSSVENIDSIASAIDLIGSSLQFDDCKRIFFPLLSDYVGRVTSRQTIPDEREFRFISTVAIPEKAMTYITDRPSQLLEPCRLGGMRAIERLLTNGYRSYFESPSSTYYDSSGKVIPVLEKLHKAFSDLKPKN